MTSESSVQRLLDIDACVKYLGELGAGSVGKSFVRGLIANGTLPYVKVGKKYFVTRTAMDTWLSRAEKRARP